MNWDVSQALPAVQAAASLDRPVVGLDFGVLDNGRVAFIPVNVLLESLDVPGSFFKYESVMMTSALDPP